MPESFRKIIHIDMDAFFASVEQLDNPELKGKAIVVGGKPNSRGVVAAASYEARKFGIHSAMSSFKASQLCPDLHFVSPRIARYREVSAQIHAVFNQYTDLIEPLSLDEAYLDVTSSDLYKGSATLIAQAIKKNIQLKTGLTASAGVSYNKFLAKLASDMDKPDGIFIIPPGKAIELIHNLPVKKLYGVGKVTAKKLHQLGIYKISDLSRVGENVLQQRFGNQGAYFYRLSQGVDQRKVNPVRVRKSIGRERTYTDDIADITLIQAHVEGLLEQVLNRMSSHDVTAKTLTLKVKYHDFVQITRSHTIESQYDNKADMYEQLLKLLSKTEAGVRPLRLLGVSVSNLIRSSAPQEEPIDHNRQRSLF